MQTKIIRQGFAGWGIKGGEDLDGWGGEAENNSRPEIRRHGSKSDVFIATVRLEKIPGYKLLYMV